MIAIVISFGISLYSLVEIGYPEFTINQWQYEQYQSNDAFWENHPQRFPPELKGKAAKKPSEYKLTKMRKKYYKIALNNERRNGFQSLVKSLIFFLISMVVFFIHWKLFKKTNTKIYR